MRSRRRRFRCRRRAGRRLGRGSGRRGGAAVRIGVDGHRALEEPTFTPAGELDLGNTVKASLSGYLVVDDDRSALQEAQEARDVEVATLERDRERDRVVRPHRRCSLRRDAVDAHVRLRRRRRQLAEDRRHPDLRRHRGGEAHEVRRAPVGAAKERFGQRELRPRFADVVVQLRRLRPLRRDEGEPPDEQHQDQRRRPRDRGLSGGEVVGHGRAPSERVLAPIENWTAPPVPVLLELDCSVTSASHGRSASLSSTSATARCDDVTPLIAKPAGAAPVVGVVLAPPTAPATGACTWRLETSALAGSTCANSRSDFSHVIRCAVMLWTAARRAWPIACSACAFAAAASASATCCSSADSVPLRSLTTLRSWMYRPASTTATRAVAAPASVRIRFVVSAPPASAASHPRSPYSAGRRLTCLTALPPPVRLPPRATAALNSRRRIRRRPRAQAGRRAGRAHASAARARR